MVTTVPALLAEVENSTPSCCIERDQSELLLDQLTVPVHDELLSLIVHEGALIEAVGGVDTVIVVHGPQLFDSSDSRIEPPSFLFTLSAQARIEYVPAEEKVYVFVVCA
jgi:hypothetical protein